MIEILLLMFRDQPFTNPCNFRRFLDEKNQMHVLFCTIRAVAVTARLISMFGTKHTTLFCENICCLEVSFAVSCIRISYIIVCSSDRSLCPTTIGPVFLKIYEQISHYNTTAHILCNCLKINEEIFKVVLERLWLYPSLYLYFYSNLICQ